MDLSIMMKKNLSVAFRNLILAVLPLMFLQSCAVFNNAKFFHKDSVSLMTFDIGSKNPSYIRINIGHLTEPIRILPEVFFEFENGEKIYIPDITVTFLQKNSLRYPVEEYFKKHYPALAGNSYKYRIGPIWGYADDNYIYTIYADPVAVLNKQMDRRYTMPITEQQAKELFGNPDQIKFGFGGT
jgi:hypothetical protein